MTVAQLIEQLKDLPQDLPVCALHGEKWVEIESVEENNKNWYYLSTINTTAEDADFAGIKVHGGR